MEMETVLNIQKLTNPDNLSTTGSLVGGLIGGAFGSPTVGASVGGIVGTIASNFFPAYSHIKGSTSGINFIKGNIKPYKITLVQPIDSVAKNISDYYCYYGCKTSRTETLNISSYLYEGHAYVRGDLQYNQSIPLDKFQIINQIFARGVHILE